MKRIIIIFIVALTFSAVSFADEAQLIRKGVELCKRPFAERKPLMKGRWMDEYRIHGKIDPPINKWISWEAKPFGNENGITSWIFEVSGSTMYDGATLISIQPGTRYLNKFTNTITATDGTQFTGEYWHFKSRTGKFSQAVMFCNDGETILFEDNCASNRLFTISQIFIYNIIKQKLEKYEANGFFE